MPDVAAERGTLAGCIQHGYDAYIDVADLITENTLSLDSNKVIWKCVDAHYKKNPNTRIDVPSIMSAAHDLGIGVFFEKPHEVNHLRQVMNMPVRLENVRRLAGKIRKLEIADLMQKQLKEAQNNLSQVTGDEPIAHILGLAENPIFEFSSLLNGLANDGPKLLGANLRGFVTHLAENPVEQVGISSGYPIYDAAIGGGFRRKSLSVVSARKKIGKSNFSNNVAAHVAGKSNIPVLYLDTEMSEEEQNLRLVALLSGVKIRKIETGKFAENSDEKRRVFGAVDLIEKMPYYHLSIAGQPFEDTVAAMRRWVLKEVGLESNGQAKDCLIIFDYIKLMDDAMLKSLSEYQAIGFITTGLHNFMAKYGCPGLALAQLNRDGDVAQSDRISWFASSVSILKALDDDDLADIPPNSGINRKMKIDCARHGPGLSDNEHIHFKADFSVGKLTEVPPRTATLNFTLEGSNGPINF